MSMASTCGRNRIVSFTGQSVIWWIYAIIYYSSGSIKTPCVSFTWHPYAQLKGIIAMLIAVCSCTHCQKVSLASNDRYRVLIQRQCLETFKISTKTGPVYWRLMIYHQPQGLRCVLHTNTHSHTFNPPMQGRFAMNTSLKKKVYTEPELHTSEYVW